MKNVLSTFATNGNPFCIITQSEMGATKVDSIYSNDDNLDSPNILDALFDDDEALNEEIDSNKRKKHTTSVVVTQSSLKGLSNFTGKYIIDVRNKKQKYRYISRFVPAFRFLYMQCISRICTSSSKGDSYISQRKMHLHPIQLKTSKP